MSTAAQAVPRLQTVDGSSTASEVGDPGVGEEAGRVPGTTLAVIADGSHVLSSGTGRWERHVRLVQGVCIGLCET